MKLRFCALAATVAVGFVALSYGSQSEALRCDEAGEDFPLELTNAVVGHDAIEMPIGRLLLVRKGQQYGAIRFVKLKKSSKDSPSWQGCARYDSWSQRDGTGDFTRTSVVHRTDVLVTLGTAGVHPFVWNRGNLRLVVGPWEFTYGFPTWVSLYPYRREAGNYGIEFAPTRWTEIREINVRAKDVAWYHFDAKARRKENETVELAPVR